MHPAPFIPLLIAPLAGGAATTHLWAYEPGLVTAARRPAGLKRLAHGIWIPA